MKKCKKCNEEKYLIEFNKSKSSKDGCQSQCKSCKNNYYQENKEKNKEYRKYNKEKIKERQKKWYQKNNEKARWYVKKYYQENIEIIKEKAKQFRQNNKEKNKEYNKQWFQSNKQKITEIKRVYQKNKRQTNPLFKLRSNISSLIRVSMKRQGYTKCSKTFEILGCSYEEFKLHIEKQFKDGMNWENAGQWHYDHIYPVSLAKDENDIIRLNHYTNFQPLWAEDNLKKSNKII